ncbi:unnamed protein product [Thlaspi arvense]|uniref:Transposase MuDR plant domain-containing protein n=1 Tax=Thlaspi arvense TaxID=13288 RepID=A0AAU9RSD3_THLAR|nr:unnamed protein product [Thlaspi arvense]
MRYVGPIIYLSLLIGTSCCLHGGQLSLLPNSDRWLFKVHLIFWVSKVELPSGFWKEAVLTDVLVHGGSQFCCWSGVPRCQGFRNAIKEEAIAQHFELRIIKSDLIRYFAKCASEGCPWRIRAVKLPNAPTFTIRSIDATHTCGKNAQNGHHQASVDWIVNFIEERLRDNINYKPKDILHDIHKQYGITIPYKQAWRAKERGLAAIYGSSEEAACSATVIGFKERLAEIEEVSSEAAKWLQQFPPSRWALVYFEGTRYGHLSSNIEEFNRWILEARELPIIQVIERIHGKLVAEFADRRAKSSSWFSVLTPSAEKRVAEAINCASTYQVLRSDEKEEEEEEDEDVRVVRPPKIRRPPGRPEKKRICVEDLNREKHTVHCSRCNQTGHYKTTCKAETKSIEKVNLRNRSYMVPSLASLQ